MPANPITAATDRRVLAREVNKRIKPYTALTGLLYARKQILTEETAQVDVREGTTGMAPFVKIGQKAVIVGSLNGTSYTITTPFINIKRPVTHTTNLAKRIAGQRVFTSGNLMRQMIRKAIQDDIDYMNAIIDNRLEWMAAMSLRGQIDYAVEGNDSFQINYGKPAANTITVSVLWTAGSGTTPLEDITGVKKVIAATRGPAPTIAIGGAEAGAALRNLIETEQIKVTKTTSGVAAVQNATLKANIEKNGFLFIAEVGGVDHYEYTGTFLPDAGGAAEPFIRTEYFEYFATNSVAQADRELLFGSMPDILAIMENQHITERYYVVKPPEIDQGTFEGIMKSRPLPWLYRPEHMVSLKVT